MSVSGCTTRVEVTKVDERMKGKLILVRSKTCCDVACDILMRVALNCDVCRSDKKLFCKTIMLKVCYFQPTSNEGQES